ncbi:hypothetical protein CgunFtcFv8_010045 [Champsocephalus gunnari]|uniref:Uncharacterized protein n=1 Tax=Champsocephalus gunnari TaxID=52237 RepID=A0AAN8DSX4_CHAGU|nr:hypothetical protein CgunFtcFv8_010045 [Champsocephalus gunnari]
MEDGVEEVVDLTCEGGEAVVDLTNNDSVLLVDEGPQNRVPSGESYVVSSDEEAPPPQRCSNALPTEDKLLQVGSGDDQLSCLSRHVLGDRRQRPIGRFH